MPGSSAEYFTTLTSTSFKWLRLNPYNVYNMQLLCTLIKKVQICNISFNIYNIHTLPYDNVVFEDVGDVNGSWD